MVADKAYIVQCYICSGGSNDQNAGLSHRVPEAGLEQIGRVTGKKQSELIREAIDMFLDSTGDSCCDAVLNEAAGIWKSRDDLSELGEARLSWNRGAE